MISLAHGLKPEAETAIEPPSTDIASETSNHPNQEDVDQLSVSASELDNQAHCQLTKGPKIGGYDGAQDAEIDPNSDRRKRRKITPISEISQDSFTATDNGSEGTEPWRQQLEEAANTINEDNSPTTALVPSSNESSVQPILSAPRRSPRVLIPRRSDADALVDAQPGQNGTSEEAKLNEMDSAGGEQKTTPKKKVLKLTSKGKLIKSPTQSPQAQKTKKAPKSSGQIAMQRGRIVPSLKVAIPYRGEQSKKAETATKIERIMQGELRMPARNDSLKKDPAPAESAQSNKPTHPFFTGKALLKKQEQSMPPSDGRSTAEASGEPSNPPIKQPIAWSDLKFSSKLSQPKDSGTQPPLWSPLSLQHVQPPTCNFQSVPILLQSTRGAKQKQDSVQVLEDEDVLKSYTIGLRNSSEAACDVQIPEHLCLDDKQMSDLLAEHRLCDKTSEVSKAALQRIKTRALVSRSAFDQGRAAGPQDWVHAYGPQRADESLQPQAKLLRDWLSELKVHHVQSKLSEKRGLGQPKRAGRKRKAKREDDLDDFIASSDEEITDKGKSVKNVILLSGPSGSGKTASVYAVARELDFEIFEIHPGMRRTAKDIFDRVGDMAHNHLVQPSAPLSRDPSNLTEGVEEASIGEDIASGKQATMGSFFGRPKPAEARPATPQPDKPNLQKQSLILFEEVDILFDDDKSFWSGVQTLARQSKRPIVLTCNNIESVPLDELEVHTNLCFDPPPVADAVEYLVHVAAAEGHLLSRKDLEGLFTGRHYDLRASLTDLNFWCQMTVGSKLGGLDWMRQGVGSHLKDSRTVSKGTYRHGLDLLSDTYLSPEDLMTCGEENFGLSTLDWEELQYPHLSSKAEDYNRSKGLRDFLHLTQMRSCMDLLDSSDRPLMSTVAAKAFPGLRRQVQPTDLIARLLSERSDSTLSCNELVDIFEPLMEDFRTFPPTTGRAATSLDGSSNTVATEIAPYVRYIVGFDQRLETQRNLLATSLQSTDQRKTRAARAALEGGDKANTRRERWFPKDLDFTRVLQTMPGGWYRDQESSVFVGTESLSSTQDTVSEDGVTVATPDASDAVMYVEKERNFQ